MDGDGGARQRGKQSVSLMFNPILHGNRIDRDGGARQRGKESVSLNCNPILHEDKLKE